MVQYFNLGIAFDCKIGDTDAILNTDPVFDDKFASINIHVERFLSAITLKC